MSALASSSASHWRLRALRSFQRVSLSSNVSSTKSKYIFCICFVDANFHEPSLGPQRPITPASSRVSRRAVTLGGSPGSMPPLGNSQIPSHQRDSTSSTSQRVPPPRARRTGTHPACRAPRPARTHTHRYKQPTAQRSASRHDTERHSATRNRSKLKTQRDPAQAQTQDTNTPHKAAQHNLARHLLSQRIASAPELAPHLRGGRVSRQTGAAPLLSRRINPRRAKPRHATHGQLGPARLSRGRPLTRS
mmetsp:Transcript_11653/g.31390  ORF Transcript_11653/g.31390 Transcript_11653/m.31390 type:complete len:248 (-) Transcript_11653:240-983(-)